MSPAMTTSDLDPDALARAWDAFSVTQGKNDEVDRHVEDRLDPLAAAITAYLTAREPGVTGKGEGE